MSVGNGTLPGERRARVFAVVNRKGGVAKTTTAITLAHGLSRKLMLRLNDDDVRRVRHRNRLYHFKGHHFYIRGHVLLVDLDPQGQCVYGLGLETDGADLGQVLLGRQALAEAIVSADRAPFGCPRPNLWLIPASDTLETAKVELMIECLASANGQKRSGEDMLRSLLEERLGLALRHFKYVVLDCPPSLDIFARAVYQFADAAIVPVKPDYLSMTGMGQHMADIRKAQLRGIEIGIHTILPTFYVSRQRLDNQMVTALQQAHGTMVSEPIPRSQMVAEAPIHKRTLFEFDPGFRNPATLAYQKLVNKVYYE